MTMNVSIRDGASADDSVRQFVMHGEPAAYFVNLVGMLQEQCRTLMHVRAARLSQESGTAARLDAIVPEVAPLSLHTSALSATVFKDVSALELNRIYDVPTRSEPQRIALSAELRAAFLELS